LTARLLQMYNQGCGQGQSLSKHTPTSLQIWYVRISLLTKLRQFSVAEVEAEPFGDLDRPDLYFQYYPEMYPGRAGSMVPFAFRVLLAELPQHLGKQHETLDRLYTLLAKVRDVLACASSDHKMSAADIALWRSRERRLLFALANCAILQKDYDLAVDSLEMLFQGAESNDQRASIMSALGRVYLQLGDVDKAQRTLAKAYKLRNGVGKKEEDAGEKCDNYMDMAFLSMANGNYANALSSLQQALEASPDNPLVVNNIAVCYLYLGKLKEGLAFLESHVTSDPSSMLQETLILNLCTLYELESSYAGQKKRALLDMVGRVKGDSLNTACLKLQ